MLVFNKGEEVQVETPIPTIPDGRGVVSVTCNEHYVVLVEINGEEYLVPVMDVEKVENFETRFSVGDKVRVRDHIHSFNSSFLSEVETGEVVEIKPNATLMGPLCVEFTYPGGEKSSFRFFERDLEKIEDNKSDLNVVGIKIPDDKEFAEFIKQMAFDYGYEWGSLSGDDLIPKGGYFACVSKDDVKDITLFFNRVDLEREYDNEIIHSIIEDVTYEKLKKVFQEDWDNLGDGYDFVDHWLVMETENENQLRAYIDVAEEFGYDLLFECNDSRISHDKWRYLTFSPKGNVNIWDREPEFPEYEKTPEYSGSNMEKHVEIGLSKLRDILDKS